MQCVPPMLIPMSMGVLCRFIDAEAVEEVLQEMSRLMPKQDPRMVLLRDPSWLLRVERGTKRLGPHPDDICMPRAPTLWPISRQLLQGLAPCLLWRIWSASCCQCPASSESAGHLA